MTILALTENGMVASSGLRFQSQVMEKEKQRLEASGSWPSKARMILAVGEIVLLYLKDAAVVFIESTKSFANSLLRISRNVPHGPLSFEKYCGIMINQVSIFLPIVDK